MTDVWVPYDSLPKCSPHFRDECQQVEILFEELIWFKRFHELEERYKGTRRTGKEGEPPLMPVREKVVQDVLFLKQRNVVQVTFYDADVAEEAVDFGDGRYLGAQFDVNDEFCGVYLRCFLAPGDDDPWEPRSESESEVEDPKPRWAIHRPPRLGPPECVVTYANLRHGTFLGDEVYSDPNLKFEPDEWKVKRVLYENTENIDLEEVERVLQGGAPADTTRTGGAGGAASDDEDYAPPEEEESEQDDANSEDGGLLDGEEEEEDGAPENVRGNRSGRNDGGRNEEASSEVDEHGEEDDAASGVVGGARARGSDKKTRARGKQAQTETAGGRAAAVTGRTSKSNVAGTTTTSNPTVKLNTAAPPSGPPPQSPSEEDADDGNSTSLSVSDVSEEDEEEMKVGTQGSKGRTSKVPAATAHTMEQQTGGRGRKLASSAKTALPARKRSKDTSERGDNINTTTSSSKQPMKRAAAAPPAATVKKKAAASKANAKKKAGSSAFSKQQGPGNFTKNKTSMSKRALAGHEHDAPTATNINDEEEDAAGAPGEQLEDENEHEHEIKGDHEEDNFDDRQQAYPRRLLSEEALNALPQVKQRPEAAMLMPTSSSSTALAVIPEPAQEWPAVQRIKVPHPVTKESLFAVWRPYLERQPGDACTHAWYWERSDPITHQLTYELAKKPNGSRINYKPKSSAIAKRAAADAAAAAARKNMTHNKGDHGGAAAGSWGTKGKGGGGHANGSTEQSGVPMLEEEIWNGELERWDKRYVPASTPAGKGTMLSKEKGAASSVTKGAAGGAPGAKQGLPWPPVLPPPPPTADAAGAAPGAQNSGAAYDVHDKADATTLGTTSTTTNTNSKPSVAPPMKTAPPPVQLRGNDLRNAFNFAAMRAAEHGMGAAGDSSTSTGAIQSSAPAWGNKSAQGHDSTGAPALASSSGGGATPTAVAAVEILTSSGPTAGPPRLPKVNRGSDVSRKCSPEEDGHLQEEVQPAAEEEDYSAKIAELKGTTEKLRTEITSSKLLGVGEMVIDILRKNLEKLEQELADLLAKQAAAQAAAIMARVLKTSSKQEAVEVQPATTKVDLMSAGAGGAPVEQTPTAAATPTASTTGTGASTADSGSLDRAGQGQGYQLQLANQMVEQNQNIQFQHGAEALSVVPYSHSIQQLPPAAHHLQQQGVLGAGSSSSSSQLGLALPPPPAPQTSQAPALPADRPSSPLMQSTVAKSAAPLGTGALVAHQHPLPHPLALAPAVYAPAFGGQHTQMQQHPMQPMPAQPGIQQLQLHQGNTSSTGQGASAPAAPRPWYLDIGKKNKNKSPRQTEEQKREALEAQRAHLQQQFAFASTSSATTSSALAQEVAPAAGAPGTASSSSSAPAGAGAGSGLPNQPGDQASNPAAGWGGEPTSKRKNSMKMKSKKMGKGITPAWGPGSNRTTSATSSAAGAADAVARGNAAGAPSSKNLAAVPPLSEGFANGEKTDRATATSKAKGGKPPKTAGGGCGNQKEQKQMKGGASAGGEKANPKAIIAVEDVAKRRNSLGSLSKKSLSRSRSGQQPPLRDTTTSSSAAGGTASATGAQATKSKALSSQRNQPQNKTGGPAASAGAPRNPNYLARNPYRNRAVSSSSSRSVPSLSRSGSDSPRRRKNGSSSGHNSSSSSSSNYYGRKVDGAERERAGRSRSVDSRAAGGGPANKKSDRRKMKVKGPGGGGTGGGATGGNNKPGLGKTGAGGGATTTARNGGNRDRERDRRRTRTTSRSRSRDRGAGGNKRGGGGGKKNKNPQRGRGGGARKRSRDRSRSDSRRSRSRRSRSRGRKSFGRRGERAARGDNNKQRRRSRSDDSRSRKRSNKRQQNAAKKKEAGQHRRRSKGKNGRKQANLALKDGVASSASLHAHPANTKETTAAADRPRAEGVQPSKSKKDEQLAKENDVARSAPGAIHTSIFTTTTSATGASSSSTANNRVGGGAAGVAAPPSLLQGGSQSKQSAGLAVGGKFASRISPDSDDEMSPKSRKNRSKSGSRRAIAVGQSKLQLEVDERQEKPSAAADGAVVPPMQPDLQLDSPPFGDSSRDEDDQHAASRVPAARPGPEFRRPDEQMNKELTSDVCVKARDSVCTTALPSPSTASVPAVDPPQQTSEGATPEGTENLGILPAGTGGSAGGSTSVAIKFQVAGMNAQSVLDQTRSLVASAKGGLITKTHSVGGNSGSAAHAHAHAASSTSFPSPAATAPAVVPLDTSTGTGTASTPVQQPAPVTTTTCFIIPEKDRARLFREWKTSCYRRGEREGQMPTLRLQTAVIMTPSAACASEDDGADRNMGPQQEKEHVAQPQTSRSSSPPTSSSANTRRVLSVSDGAHLQHLSQFLRNHNEQDCDGFSLEKLDLSDNPDLTDHTLRSLLDCFAAAKKWIRLIDVSHCPMLFSISPLSEYLAQTALLPRVHYTHTGVAAPKFKCEEVFAQLLEKERKRTDAVEQLAALHSEGSVTGEAETQSGAGEGSGTNGPSTTTTTAITSKASATTRLRLTQAASAVPFTLTSLPPHPVEDSSQNKVFFECAVALLRAEPREDDAKDKDKQDKKSAAQKNSGSMGSKQLPLEMPATHAFPPEWRTLPGDATSSSFSADTAPSSSTIANTHPMVLRAATLLVFFVNINYVTGKVKGNKGLRRRDRLEVERTADKQKNIDGWKLKEIVNYHTSTDASGLATMFKPKQEIARLGDEAIRNRRLALVAQAAFRQCQAVQNTLKLTQREAAEWILQRSSGSRWKNRPQEDGASTAAALGDAGAALSAAAAPSSTSTALVPYKGNESEQQRNEEKCGKRDDHPRNSSREEHDSTVAQKTEAVGVTDSTSRHTHTSTMKSGPTRSRSRSREDRGERGRGPRAPAEPAPVAAPKMKIGGSGSTSTSSRGVINSLKFHHLGSDSGSGSPSSSDRRKSASSSEARAGAVVSKHRDDRQKLRERLARLKSSNSASGSASAARNALDYSSCRGRSTTSNKNKEERIIRADHKKRPAAAAHPPKVSPAAGAGGSSRDKDFRQSPPATTATSTVEEQEPQNESGRSSSCGGACSRSRSRSHAHKRRRKRRQRSRSRSTSSMSKHSKSSNQQRRKRARARDEGKRSHDKDEEQTLKRTLSRRSNKGGREQRSGRDKPGSAANSDGDEDDRNDSRSRGSAGDPSSKRARKLPRRTRTRSNKSRHDHEHGKSKSKSRACSEQDDSDHGGGSRARSLERARSNSNKGPELYNSKWTRAGGSKKTVQKSAGSVEAGNQIVRCGSNKLIEECCAAPPVANKAPASSSSSSASSSTTKNVSSSVAPPASSTTTASRSSTTAGTTHVVHQLHQQSSSSSSSPSAAQVQTQTSVLSGDALKSLTQLNRKHGGEGAPPPPEPWTEADLHRTLRAALQKMKRVDPLEYAVELKKMLQQAEDERRDWLAGGVLLEELSLSRSCSAAAQQGSEGAAGGEQLQQAEHLQPRLVGAAASSSSSSLSTSTAIVPVSNKPKRGDTIPDALYQESIGLEVTATFKKAKDNYVWLQFEHPLTKLQSRGKLPLKQECQCAWPTAGGVWKAPPADALCPVRIVARTVDPSLDHKYYVLTQNGAWPVKTETD